MQEFRTRAGMWVARHPQVTLTLVMLTVLIAFSGGVAADGGVSTSEVGCGSGGPTDPDSSC